MTATEQWMFYIIKENGQQIVYQIRKCKKPATTTTWKRLQEILQKEDVKEVGYKIM